MRLSTHRRVKAEDIDLHKGERESRIDKRMRNAKETEQHLEIFFLGLIAFIAVLRVSVVSFAHWLHTASTDSLTEGSCSLWHFCYTLPPVFWFIFLPSFVPHKGTAPQGQDFLLLSVYNLSEFTPFSSSLKSSGSDLSRKNKLADCVAIRKIIHIKHSPCEHECNKSSFKKLERSAVAGRYRLPPAKVALLFLCWI